MNDITLEELKSFANDFLMTHYQIKLEIPLILNGRLRVTLGQMRTYLVNDVTDDIEIPLRLELSKNLLIYYPKTEVLDVLKHELVHYALCEKGLPFWDGDPYFEQELERLGISSTDMIEYKGILHTYRCTCGELFMIDHKIHSTDAESDCCNKPLIYVGKTIIRS